MKTNQFSTFITHDTVNNESNRLVSFAVPEHVSSFPESSVSVCVEGTVAIPAPKQSPVPEVLTHWGYVHSLFVLNSSINALLDSYPATWLAEVVALLPPVAFALYRPYVV
jgi:hypothetical protein